MPFFDIAVNVPYSMRQADQRKMDDYNRQIDAYTAAVDLYKQQIADYNKAVEDYNAGARDKEFSVKEPTAPTEPGFTQAELDAFQADAQRRGQIKQTQLQRGINIVRAPQSFENINLAGMSFAQGGAVPDLMAGIGSLGLPSLFLR